MKFFINMSRNDVNFDTKRVMNRSIRSARQVIKVRLLSSSLRDSTLTSLMTATQSTPSLNISAALSFVTPPMTMKGILGPMRDLHSCNVGATGDKFLFSTSFSCLAAAHLNTGDHLGLKTHVRLALSAKDGTEADVARPKAQSNA